MAALISDVVLSRSEDRADIWERRLVCSVWASFWACWSLFWAWILVWDISSDRDCISLVSASLSLLLAHYIIIDTLNIHWIENGNKDSVA